VAAGEGILVPLVVVAPLLGAAIGVQFSGSTLRLGTPAGFAVWCRVEAFRRHLTSGPPAAARALEAGRLDEFTAWAVALGVGKEWAKAVAGIRPSVPDEVRLRARAAARLPGELAAGADLSPS
jgi:hypothetical protein